MSKQRLELDLVVALLDSIELRGRKWYPLANKLVCRFGVNAVRSIFADLGETRLRKMGVSGFVGMCHRLGWERKAEFEKMVFDELRHQPAPTGKNEEGFGSIGEILSHLNKKITIAGMPEMEDAHV